MELYQRIADFYDSSSGLWERIWSEHMHHGYYGRGGKIKLDRRQAQIDLIEELLTWGGVTGANQILDVGCGIGGSSLYLAQKFHSQGVGITLSPVQAARASQRAQEFNLEEQVSFCVADALKTPFPENNFDLVWSLESGEHMPDKRQFLRECYRVLQPGGTFLMATWCHRPITSLAGNLTEGEIKLLNEIYQVYCLPYVISLPEYADIAREVGFQDLKTDDWSLSVAAFWDVVIDSALSTDAIAGLLASGYTTIQGALSLGLMRRGYESGLIRFGLLQGKK
ncbi:MAG: methyltransferase domain-containing protein [Microcystis panniformis]